MTDEIKSKDRQDVAAKAKPEPRPEDERWLYKLRKFASWAFVLCSCIVTLVLAYLLIRGSMGWPDFFVIAIRHFPAVVGLPLAAVASLFIVIVLKVISGEKLSFKIWGLNFEGASGPVILWMLCFLAMALAINTLWDKKSDDPISFRQLYENGNFNVDRYQHR